MSAFVDTNVLVRHLVGEPAEMAARASAYLASESELLVVDLVVAETVYVLESFYETPRAQVVAQIERELLALYRDEQLVTKPAALQQRGGAFYSEAAAQLGQPLGQG